MACPSCGSWSVKADRSLGGRYVCGRCGRPLGMQAERQVRRRQGNPGLRLPRRGWWVALGLLALGALFAALEMAPQRPRRPLAPQPPLLQGVPGQAPPRSLSPRTL
jgi:hypothetical protein